jgi:hypothetical protein
MRGRIAVALALAGGLIFSAQAQTTVAQQPPAARKPAPAFVLYHLLFRHLTELHNRASASNGDTASSRDPALLYKHALSLNDADYSKLLVIAKDCEAAVAHDDQQARAIIQQARSEHPGGKIAAGGQLPAVPDSLRTLQADRNNVINAAIARMNRELSPGASSHVQGFIATRLAPRSGSAKLSKPHQRIGANPTTPVSNGSPANQ